MRRSNPVFKPTGLLRPQKTQVRNDGADLRNNAGPTQVNSVFIVQLP